MSVSKFIRSILPDMNPAVHRMPASKLRIPRFDFSKSDEALERELQQATADLTLGRIHHRKTRPAHQAQVKAKARQLAREIGWKPHRRARGWA